MFDFTDHAWHNGKILPRAECSPSVGSPSLQLGVAVFDGMMAYWNGDHYNIFRMHDHLTRFAHNAANMELSYPWSTAEIESGVRELLAGCSPQTYYVRPIAYRAGPQLNVSPTPLPVTDLTVYCVTAPRDVDKPLTCTISTVQRISSNAVPVSWKVCGTYANSYLARRSAHRAQFDDGIFLNSTGFIAEASAANIFFIKGDRLVTPSIDCDCFPGITRVCVMELAEQAGVKVVQEQIRPSELSEFDAAFLTATLMELKPISRVDDVHFPTAGHPLFRELLSGFRRLTHS
jgi:branched-chain amino acid aminotransferase